MSAAALALSVEQPADPARVADMRALAGRLAGENRVDDATLLLEHLAAFRPGDAQTLRPLIKLLSAQKRTLDVIGALCALKAVATDQAALLSDISSEMQPAIENFNAHLAAGEIDLAERYASAMAALVPRNRALLNAALNCNEALGHRDKAAQYTAALAALDAQPAAAPAPEKPAPVAVNTETDIETRVAAALLPNGDTHPLLRLRDLHDAMSAILCQPLTPHGVQQIEQLLAAGHALSVPVPEGSEWAGWEKHYRLMLDAADMPAMLGATPEAKPEPDMPLVTSTGAASEWSDLHAAAEKLGARCVFFVAADRHYVDLYAKLYIASVLKHCEVPCLIVVHVIGGAQALKDAAKAIGIRDKRLFFTGDAFDANAVTTSCYDTPPKGRIAKPVAHFQSVRFQRLGALLQTVKRPVFVSDIDLLLQRGVADLLETAADYDVMFNENSISAHAGSRLTANLLLVSPSEEAALFLNFLSAYLKRFLAKPEVTRWIDQFGLLMARHHLSLRARNARIGYFDTEKDINNVMYPSYRCNPFRFLSLYHGFDLSSLEETSKPAAKKPKRKTEARG